MMRALVTRPRENADSITRILADRDIQVLLEPLLDIRPTDHEPLDLQGVQALLVTSPAGARALGEAMTVRDVPVYAVGDATADLLREAGFAKVESARGDSEDLATLVSERLNPKDGALLYASGRTVAGEFSERLSTSGFEVRRVELYAARPAAALSEETVKALREGKIDIALFFSPRTAQTFTRLVKDAGIADRCSGIRAFCLSPTVAEAIKNVSWAAVAVAEKPEQLALVDRIDAYVASLADPAADEAAVPEPDAPAVPVPVATPPPPRQSRAPAFAAIALALVAIIAVVLLWQNQQDLAARVADADAPAGQAVSNLQQRVQDLSGTVAGLQSRIEQPRDTAAVDERLAELQAAMQSRSNEIAGTVDDVRREIEDLRAGTTARLEEVSSAGLQPSDLQEIGGRIDALAGRLGEELAQVRGELEAVRSAAAAAQKAADEAAGRTTAAAMLALGQLQAAVETGRPFAEPLGQLQRLVGEMPGAAGALEGWSDRADTGISTLPALQQRFDQLVVEAGRRRETVADPGWLDRAREQAASIVSIRRVDEGLEGDSRGAILARAAGALRQNDLAKAVAEVGQLSGTAAAIFSDWLEDARARLAATNGVAALQELVIAEAGGLDR